MASEDMEAAPEIVQEPTEESDRLKLQALMDEANMIATRRGWCFVSAAAMVSGGEMHSSATGFIPAPIDCPAFATEMLRSWRDGFSAIFAEPMHEWNSALKTSVTKSLPDLSGWPLALAALRKH